MKKNYGKSFIEYNVEDEELVVEQLYVHDQQRGERMGYFMLTQAVQYARENGIQEITLYAEPQEEMNPKYEAWSTVDWLVEYYRDFGFVSHGDNDQLMRYEV